MKFQNKNGDVPFFYLIKENLQDKTRKFSNFACKKEKNMYNILCNKFGELAERSKAAVLKTVVVKATWGSNP